MAEEKERESLNIPDKSGEEKGDGGMNKMTEKKKQRSWRVASWMVTMTTLLLLVALLFVTIIWKIERHRDLEPREQTLCVLCTDLTKTPKADYSELPEVARHYTDDEKTAEMCCGEASGILSKMVQKYTELKYEDAPPPVYTECNTRSKPAARLAGVVVSNMQQGKTNNDIIQWNSSSSMSFTKTGTSYEKGYITISEDGYYYVFCQVKYTDVTTNPATGTNLDYVAYDDNRIHSIHHFSSRHSTEERLVESSMLQCKTSSQSTNSTNFMGAVFKLEANDKVFVRASHPHLVTACEHGNFFGLYTV